jgi:hypothetical protein
LCTFAKCYFQDNAGDVQCCPFKSEDSIYLLAFALIMLNTDLHKSQSESRKATRKKMTKAEFISNLRGAEQGENISKEYLSSVYESINKSPIAMHADSTERRAGSSMLQDILNNVRSADTLLRGLAVHDLQFATIDDYVNRLPVDSCNVSTALADLTRSCVATTWQEWYGVINTGLETAHLDPTGMEPSVDILLYALSLTVCLEMPIERSAFLSQLGRLKAFEERRHGQWVSAHDQVTYLEEKWYRDIEAACAGTADRKLWALQQIYDWMKSLKSALCIDFQNKVKMTEIVRQLRNGEFLLQDPARSFICCDDLLKKSARTGRSQEYRFVLFSDVLVYAHKEEDGRYKIHEKLPLHLMKVVDFFPPTQKLRTQMLEIRHPRKSFVIVCPSSTVRNAWVEKIKASLNLEMERQCQIEAARMAVHAAR